jgi:hypothetical protein
MCVRPLSTNSSQRCTCTGCMLLLPPFYYRQVSSVFPQVYWVGFWCAPSSLGWVVVWDTCTHWHAHTHTRTLYVSHRVPTAMPCAVAAACVLAPNLEPTFHGLPTQHPHATPCVRCMHRRTQRDSCGEKTKSLRRKNMASFASWSTQLLPPEQSPPLPAFARSRPCVGCTHHIVKSVRHTGNKSIRHTRNMSISHSGNTSIRHTGNSHDCACIGMCEPATATVFRPLT